MSAYLVDLIDQARIAREKVAACERQVNELAEINKELVNILKMARLVIAEDRNVFFESNEIGGKVDDEAMDALAVYDVTLKSIDAVVEKAEQQ